MPHSLESALMERTFSACDLWTIFGVVLERGNVLINFNRTVWMDGTQEQPIKCESRENPLMGSE